jgi:phosphate transport system substrate-binding protein
MVRGCPFLSFCSMSQFSRVALVVGAFLWVHNACAEVTGAGASFPSKVYKKWGERYEKDAGVRIVYRPTGSGDGVKQISDRAVQFAGSDTPLPPQELSKRQLIQLPMVVGGIVPVVNLPGISEGELQLDGPTLADIMRGAIERWDDPRIAAQNRGTRMPALPIRRIVRADKSGTSEGLARYLALVSDPFKTEVGVSQLPNWPGAVTRAEGNDGVAQAIKGSVGAISYVSYDRVVHDKLASVRLQNAAGRYVAASETGFRAAIVASELGRSGDDLASLLNRPGVESWPITSATFVLLDAAPKLAAGAAPAMRFLYWCFLHGDELTKGTGFAPLPINVQSRLSARFAAVKAQDGQPVPYFSY